jgi:hypothetical protein
MGPMGMKYIFNIRIGKFSIWAKVSQVSDVVHGLLVSVGARRGLSLMPF